MRIAEAGVVALALSLLSSLATAADTPLLAAGERVYVEGRAVSGEKLKARVAGDVAVDGGQFACASCHRRSGFGTSEGANTAPPLIAPILFAPRAFTRPELGRGRSRGPATRPAYDDASLLRAIRFGIDPQGRPLDPVMPRYELDDGSGRALVDYLHSLSGGPDPGVDGHLLHLALVVDDRVPPEVARAWRSTLEAYVATKNAGARFDDDRAQHAPWPESRKYPAYRRWQLHHWTLQGDPSTWGPQLDAYYREGPVFAVAGALLTQDGAPLEQFCEGHALPCLFPRDHSDNGTASRYVIRFTGGRRVVRSAVTLHRSGKQGSSVIEFTGGAGEGALGRLLDTTSGDMPRSTTPVTLLVWGVPTAAEWSALTSREESLAAIYLATDEEPEIPAPLLRHTFWVTPYTLQRSPRSEAALDWIGRHTTVKSARLQLELYFAATQMGEALNHMNGYFSRDYFMERLEHAVTRALFTADYPSMSLGPEQRVAVHGCYVRARREEAGGWSEEWLAF